MKTQILNPVGRLVSSTLALSAFLTVGGSAMAALPGATAIVPQGVESLVRFQSVVVMPSNLAYTPDNTEFLINEQTKHLLGTFASPLWAKKIGVKPNEDLGLVGLGNLISYTVVGTQKTDAGLEITYRAVQKMIVHNRLMSPGQTINFPLIFPHNPEAFYVRACTDPTYYEKEYLFYYWDPLAPTCAPHLTGVNSVDTVNAVATGLNPVVASAQPDWARLEAQVKTRGEIHLTILFGFDVSETNKDDEGRQSYAYFMNYFTKTGFTVDTSRNPPNGPNAELYRDAGPNRPKAHVSLALSASDINSPVVFARRAREAFETSDIVIYEGHSGLGGNLNLPKITELSSPDPTRPVPINFPNAYQVYYFDSCESYYFYSQMYSLAKRGAHHVDMVGNGLSARFTFQNEEARSIADSFLQPNPSATWLDILNAVEKPHPAFTYLLNVSPIRN